MSIHCQSSEFHFCFHFFEKSSSLAHYDFMIITPIINFVSITWLSSLKSTLRMLPFILNKIKINVNSYINIEIDISYCNYMYVLKNFL